MAILKHEYEISIWDEHLDSTGKKVESKGAIIGAHDMTYLGRAINPNLKREVKGTNTLTFDMVETFFDSEKGEYVKNEFIDMLYNERKLKLHYKGKWYEFYIKNIIEDKKVKEHTRSFTCTDSFIDELSRTGYGVTFDTELYNNVDEVGNFSNEILKDSIWDYRPDLNSGDFTEFREERCYKIPLSQFGGSLKAYPVDLNVSKEAYKKESNYFSNKNFNEEMNKTNFNSITNIYSGETRQLEYGDDISREREIFWDSYFKDNGSPLIDDSNLVEIKGDYIYVPFTYLSFIFGSIFSSAYHATEEPAKYGKFGDSDLGFALQPVSKDPTDLIQFLFFNNNDKVLIDEEGYIANNDHHYVITVGQWNDALKKVLDNKVNSTDDKGLIYWQSERSDNAYTTKYAIKTNGTIDYTIDVRPDTRTIDDFCWYPAYYEGYLEQIGDTEVYGARNISITDRTEFNLDKEYYTTVYNNKATDFKGLYSEKEIDSRIDDNFLPRVQSMEETRIVVPTLAKNLVQNGEKIAKNDGWEALTQNNTTDFNTGSYANLLSLTVKSTTGENPNKEEEDKTIDIDLGDTDAESINDFYLEILSPNIMKCNDIDYEGTVSSDYALNFGLSAKEINIEKDKIYALRICTGTWTIDNYSITFRNSNPDEEKDKEEIFYTEEQTKIYEKTLKEYNELLRTCDLTGITLQDTEETVLNYLNKLVEKHDKAATNELEKFKNVVIDTDINYLIYRLYENPKDIPEDKQSDYTELDEYAYKNWIAYYIVENKTFGKKFNVDLDKIIIGQGSIDINGNYTLSGATSTKEPDNYISFADIFEEIETNGDKLSFVPKNSNNKIDYKNNNPLIKTLHHKKVKGKWTWEEVKSDISIEDNTYLLFKAKANITTPYIGIRSDSEPMTFTIDSTEVNTYSETNFKGIKMEVYSEDENSDKYLVNNANIKIFKVDNKNFSDDFLQRCGWKLAESTGTVSEDSNGEAFTFVTTETSVGHGIDVSVHQSTIDWKAVKSSGKVDNVIIRLGYGVTGIDSQAENNIKGCVENQIPYGFYWFGYADTIEGAEEEAKKFVKRIKELVNTEEKKKYFQWPAFYDIERTGTENATGDLLVAQGKTDIADDMVKAFKKVVTDEGLYFGIYTGGEILGYIGEETYNDSFVWYAGYVPQESKKKYYSGHHEIWQYSGTGSINGINGNVDLNHFYVKPIPGLHSFKVNETSSAQLLLEDEESTTSESNFNLTLDDLNITNKIKEYGHSDERPNQSDIKGIVIHSVGDGDPDPLSWLNKWNGSVDAHYVAGRDGNIVQYISLDKVAYHTRGNNYGYIGIEQSEPGPNIMNYVLNPDGLTFSDKFSVAEENISTFKNFAINVYNTTVKLTATLCKKYNLDPLGEGVIRGHCEIQDHSDPKHLWQEGRKGAIYDANAEKIDISLTMDTFRQDVKNMLEGTSGGSVTGSSPEQDKKNRENPNNDYTLKEGDLLPSAKPCWTATTFEDVEAYFNNISPKTGDICTLAYSLFVNDLYYGIFWLDEISGILETDESTKEDNTEEENNEQDKEEEVK